MAPPRAFNYDLLRGLVLGHPNWSTFRYAAALTADNRRRDPHARQVQPATVDSVISRLKAIWEEEEGRRLPRRVPVYDIAPPAGALNSRNKNDTAMKYLRELAQEASGNVPDTVSEVRVRASALNWEKRMRRDRMVVDLTAAGVPITRPARTEEVNSLGGLVSLMAWKIPGWRQKAAV